MSLEIGTPSSTPQIWGSALARSSLTGNWAEASLRHWQAARRSSRVGVDDFKVSMPLQHAGDGSVVIPVRYCKQGETSDLSFSQSIVACVGSIIAIIIMASPAIIATAITFMMIFRYVYMLTKNNVKTCGRQCCAMKRPTKTKNREWVSCLSDIQVSAKRGRESREMH
ncbi:Non-specific lipid-transfer protein A [Senna tora]|uniref:Non-specific lipid-transfer protein A n=1 Tax=Senna tora TaxID=362788 RepID=A0A834WW12_9FABA|nr:Non-specific lipid-transfer protein A [Senna tora]